MRINIVDAILQYRTILSAILRLSLYVVVVALQMNTTASMACTILDSVFIFWREDQPLRTHVHDLFL